MDENTRLNETFQDEAIHDKWESVYRGNQSLDRLNDAIVARFLKRIDQTESCSVLDAGCGVGDHTLRFARLGHQATGVDISAPMLDIARQRAAMLNLPAEFLQLELEDLSQLADRKFDVVHCRGVLMHIPAWKLALQQLAQCVRPGGHLFVIEANHRSVELGMVRLLRRLRKSSRKMVQTADGIEFHDDKSGYAPLTRAANIKTLIAEFERLGFGDCQRFTTQFFDVNRFPKGLQTAAVHWNRISFECRFPSVLCCENGVIGRKSL